MSIIEFSDKELETLSSILHLTLLLCIDILRFCTRLIMTIMIVVIISLRRRKGRRWNIVPFLCFSVVCSISCLFSVTMLVCSSFWFLLDYVLYDGASRHILCVLDIVAGILVSTAVSSTRQSVSNVVHFLVVALNPCMLYDCYHDDYFSDHSVFCLVIREYVETLAWMSPKISHI